MKVVSVKVEIPDGWELACDRMRPRKKGERCLSANGGVLPPASCDDSPAGCKYNVIVRQAWVWPSWLKAAAVVRTKQGGLLACQNVPRLDHFQHYGWAKTGNTLNVYPANATFACIDNFPDVPWEESLRVNPNMERERRC